MLDKGLWPSVMTRRALAGGVLDAVDAASEAAGNCRSLWGSSSAFERHAVVCAATTPAGKDEEAERGGRRARW